MEGGALGAPHNRLPSAAQQGGPVGGFPGAFPSPGAQGLLVGLQDPLMPQGYTPVGEGVFDPLRTPTTPPTNPQGLYWPDPTGFGLDRQIPIYGMVTPGGGDPLSNFRTSPAQPVAFRLDARRPERRGAEKPSINPDKYYGKQTFDDYLKHFEIVAGINAWDNEMKRIFLLVVLQGKVQEYANDLPENVRADYDLLCGALIEQFGAHKLVDSYRQELLSCQQGKDEKLRDLGSRVRRLVTRAFPSGDLVTKESMTVHHFVQAIREQSLRIQVKRVGPSNLEEAIKVAMREESIVSGEKVKFVPRVHASQPPKESNTSDSKQLVEKLQKRIQELEDQLKGKTESKRETPQRKEGESKSGISCWYCHQPGHCKYNCAKFQADSPDGFLEYLSKREILKQGNGEGRL